MACRLCLIAILFPVCLTDTTAQVLADEPTAQSHSGAQLRPAASPEAEGLPRAVEDPALEASVLTEFGLAAARLAMLEIPAIPTTSVTTVVPFEGEDMVIELHPHSVFAPGYKLLVQVADGSIVRHDPGPVRTTRGTVVGRPGSVVSASVLDEGLLATISLADGRVIRIEPVVRRLPGAPIGLHVIYRDDDRIPSGGTCGNELDPLPGTAPEGNGSSRGTACGAGMCVAELGCDADVEYFQAHGSNVTSTQNQIAAVIDGVNIEYERDVQITFQITTIIVRTAQPDPYTQSGSDALLCEFITEWTNNQQAIAFDVAKLFTGRNISGSTIGQAANFNQICDRQGFCTGGLDNGAFCYSQNDCCGSFGCATDLAAHELGHLWGGTHCCPGTTMTTPLACANVFDPFSIGQIVAERDSVSCLQAPEPGTTTLPFFDDFPSTTIDANKWTGIDGAQVNSSGVGEPSGTLSLNLDGNSSTGGDEIRSAIMDTSLGINTPLSYWYERTGGANSPEPGEDLVVEYLNNVGVWTEINRHLGSGADMSTYQFVSLTLPSDAYHSSFRVRFRAISSANGADDWFVDDVNIDLGDITPPTPDPMTFAVLPPTVLSDTQIQFEATTATDPSGVEYFFNKQFGPGCCGTDSGWQASTTYIATGLQANASYSYKVKARDLSINFNETALSTLFGTNSTFIETPTTITLIDAQDTQLTVSVTCDDLGDPNRCVGGSFSNLTGNPPSGLFFDMTPLEGSGSNTWVDTQQITITGLTPNTAYTFKAKARNRMAIETAFSPPVVFNTTGAAGCPTVAGDINQDTLVDGNDIPGFVRAKLGQPPVGGEDQTCADFGTGDVMLDVAAFVTALIN